MNNPRTRSRSDWLTKDPFVLDQACAPWPWEGLWRGFGRQVRALALFTLTLACWFALAIGVGYVWAIFSGGPR